MARTTTSAVTARFTVTSSMLLDQAGTLTAEELAHACGAHLEWVAQLGEAGIVHAPASQPHETWRFQSRDLQQALEARRLERDFGAGLDAAALILDMSQEIRRLRALLAAHGVQPAMAD